VIAFGSRGTLTPGIRFSTFGTVKATAARRARVIDDTDGSCAVECIDERKVAAVRAASPAAEDIERVAERFSALSDPTRIRLLHALSRAELCVCDLSKVAGRSMPATSQQLQLLRRLGLVKYRSQGKLAYYSLADAWVQGALETALDEMQETRR
jgi:DNA-binding transcriptional ArsR family regulator